MTLIQLVAMLQQLLREQPETADYLVVVCPHGNSPRQGLETVHQRLNTIQLEARA